MEKSTKSDQTAVGCGQPEGHRDHLCLLMERGMVAEIAERTRKPRFFCASCSARADRKEDLCQPQPLPKQQTGPHP